MRYLRMAALCVFVISLGFFAWANLRYYSSLNTDMPTISADTDLLIIGTADGPEALLQGLTAYDKTDGDLTDRIMVASVSHFIENNTVNVKYVVFDSSNNAASLTRKVCYTDYESPRFSLDVPAVITRGENFNLLNHVKVTDCIDGDLSNQIRVITNMVNIYAAGVYPVTLEVTNSCGDMSQLTLWVTVLERGNSAVIELKQYITYVEQGTTFDPYSYIQKVTNEHGTALSKDKVQVKGSLDLNAPGVYRLEYRYSDQQESGQTSLTVVVESGEEAS